MLDVLARLRSYSSHVFVQAIIAQHPQETRLSGLLADAEDTTQWVTRHLARFTSRSILTRVAFTSSLQWFETEVLAEERNYQGLARLTTVFIQHALTRSPASRVPLDIDSSFNQDRDCLAATLWTANVHSADGWITCCLSGADDGGDDGPEPEVSEDLLDYRRLLDKKTVNHRLAVLE